MWPVFVFVASRSVFLSALQRAEPLYPNPNRRQTGVFQGSEPGHGPAVGGSIGGRGPMADLHLRSAAPGLYKHAHAHTHTHVGRIKMVFL